MTLQVKNWTQFQHYKHRQPPWIKLHRSLLDDPAYWRLPVASRALAPCIWLLASESEEGTLSADPEELAFRFRMSVSDVVAAVNPLIDKGFLDGHLLAASAVLAPCLQGADSETETEKSRGRVEERTSEPVVSATAHGNGARKATVTALEKPSPPWSKEAAIDWDARFGLGSCNPGRIGKALSPLVKVHGWDRVRPAWVRYLREKEAEFVTPQDFASKFGVWSGDAAPAQGKQTKGQELAAMAARFIARGEP